MRNILKAGFVASTLSMAFLAMAQTAVPAAAATTTNTATATAIAPTAGTTPGDAEFAQKHPRIHEVNQRLRSERERIQADFKGGKINATEAKELMKKARKIHHEELRDAMKNDGHLSKAEQEKLNHEENHLSDEIHDKASSTEDTKHKK